MIVIEPNVKKLMLEDVVKAYPDECCGFLFGTEKNEDRTITAILIVTNAKDGDKRRRFEIAPKDYIKAERYADENNLALLGIYHSHPNHPAIPSEYDRVAAQPYFSYIIVSVADADIKTIRSWRLNDEQQFEEEKITQYQFA